MELDRGDFSKLLTEGRMLIEDLQVLPVTAPWPLYEHPVTLPWRRRDSTVARS